MRVERSEVFIVIAKMDGDEKAITAPIDWGVLSIALHLTTPKSLAKMVF